MSEQRVTRRRYLGALGTAGTAGLAGCSETLAGELLQSNIDEATRERYVGVATQTAAEVEEWHRARSWTTRRLALTEPAQSGTAEERQHWLQAEADRLPEDVLAVHIVDPSDDWTVVASTNEAKHGEVLNTREAPWQNDSLEYGENGVFISRAVEALTRSLVSFVVPVDTDGDRQTLLVVQTDMDEVASTFQQPAEGGYSQLVDADGRIVAGSQETEALERNDGSLSKYPGGTDATALQEALGGQSGFVAGPVINDRAEADDEETAYVVAYAGVENRAWAVLTHVPRQTAQNG